MLMLINYFIKTQSGKSDSLILWNWIKSTYVLEYLGHCLTCLLRKVNPLFHIVLCICTILSCLRNTLPPYNS